MTDDPGTTISIKAALTITAITFLLLGYGGGLGVGFLLWGPVQ